MDLVFKYIEDFLHTAFWKYCIKYISCPNEVNIYLQLVQRFNFAAMGVLKWKSLHSYEMVFFSIYSEDWEVTPYRTYNLSMSYIQCFKVFMPFSFLQYLGLHYAKFHLSLIFFHIMGGMFFLQTYSACHLKVILPISRFSTEYWHWEEFVFIDGKTDQYWREHCTY